MGLAKATRLTRPRGLGAGEDGDRGSSIKCFEVRCYAAIESLAVIINLNNLDSICRVSLPSGDLNSRYPVPIKWLKSILMTTWLGCLCPTYCAWSQFLESCSRAAYGTVQFEKGVRKRRVVVDNQAKFQINSESISNLMTIKAARLEELLEQINTGQTKKALASIEKWLLKEPGHRGLLELKAEGLRLAGREAEAIEAFKEAGEAGAGARNWMVAGILLATERNKTDEAVACLKNAAAEAPDNDDVLNVLVTTFFNANRHEEGLEFARRQLVTSRNPRFLSNAALLLQCVDLQEESSSAFRKILDLAGDDPAFIGAALVPARFTCDWEYIESLQQKISERYAQGQFGATQEYPLTHITWCVDEAYNLGVTRAYSERMTGAIKPLAAQAARPVGGRIRVGFLSCDFRNHATMHLVAGLFEHLDRNRFEVFAYDYSKFEESEYRQRFLSAVEHHVDVQMLSDGQAALRIMQDQLDILIDMKGYTGSSRPGIVAHRPVPLQVAYLGYPGSAANADIDYIVSDRFVTPDSSTPYYTEKFCRLPHSYQCNDRKRVVAPEVRGRAAYGLPDDKVIFGAFNQSYKVDRLSFNVWMQILTEVPNSVLWLLGQNQEAIVNLSRYAQLAGVDVARLIFAPFAAPLDHLARLQLADAGLDTLVCNGHTTTSDALWAGVPVITARGRHFSSRVSESLLNALELPELVGVDQDDMVRIAKRIGTDVEYRLALRQKVAANRQTSPMFDTQRYTRNFETAIEMMTQAHRSGAVSGHIDVPDIGDVSATEHGPAEPGLSSIAQSQINSESILEPMTIKAERLEELLEQINSGQAKKALPSIDKWLQKQPGHLALLGLRAEALRLIGHVPEAIEALKEAGRAGAGARNWMVAGIMLAEQRNTEDAVACLLRAIAETPDSDEVLNVLITTLFNANRHEEGIEFARRQLVTSRNPRYLSNAALLLHGIDLHEESSKAFGKILELVGDDPAFIGAALVPARFTCDWEYIETLQQKIAQQYAQGQFGAPQEYPLTHITWCANEAYNLGVTRAYVERMVGVIEPLAAQPARPLGGRIRVGFLSCDFRNHATMHLVAGLFEYLDRNRFEVFAYDYSKLDGSEYRERFLNAVEHHVQIDTLNDKQAALRIAQDQLDLLFDMKGYTGGSRPGIAAHRPAPLQAAYLGYPGSAANADIDYIVSDRFVTPDSSTPYYTEKFCRLPHSYQCNDRKRVVAPEVRGRAAYGLPDDKVIFGAFNQSYKIDRLSFTVWMQILTEVPNSVLWLLGQNEEAIVNLSRYARLAGVDVARLIFAPFAAPLEHLARLQLADAGLDTLVCNGHTTTSDALWAGVPVITARGRHFSSRVSESLLNALELPELVGVDQDDMVRIAKQIGTDAEYRLTLRQKVAANRQISPLFDTQRYTRNFETAIEMMTQAHRSGAVGGHIDVPDIGDVGAPEPDLRANAAAHLDVNKSPKRYAIITPYQQESREMLERCIRSVRNQTLAVDHILVADGYPQDWIDAAGVRHLRLDRAHDDFGNTARALGAMLAIAEQYDGIGLLNAQNWLDANHIASCVDTFREASAQGPVDYVIARRKLCRPDESVLLAWQEPLDEHVDTNCFFFFPPAYPMVPHFGLMPKELSLLGDRFFYQALRDRGLHAATNEVFTVNDLCLWESLYLALGETPPPGAKPNIDDRVVHAWLESRTPEERQLVLRLTGNLP